MSFIRVTLDFQSQAELLDFFSGKATPAVAPATKTEKATPKQEPKVEPPKPEPAAATSAPEKVAASTASSSEGEASPALTEADLTKVVVATVARTSREQVLELLQREFGVTAGKQITDPAVRAQAKAALEAL